MSTAAPVTSSVGQSLKERDGGEKQPVAPVPEDTNSQDQELVELLKECVSTLGSSSLQDGTPRTKGKPAMNLLAYFLPVFPHMVYFHPSSSSSFFF